MAAFNPVAPEVIAQNMTGRSQGIPDSKVFSTLFGGIGEIAGAYAKAVDERNKTNIYNETVAGRDQAAAPLIAALTDAGGTSINGVPAGAAGTGQPPAQPVNATASAPGAVFSGPKPGQPITIGDADPITTGSVALEKAPQEVKNAAAKKTTLDQALAAGTITQGYYDLQLYNMASGLRSKYPGYGQEIDAIVQNVTGKDPTNALVGDFYEMARANAATGKSDEDKWQSYITSNANSDALKAMVPDVWTNPRYADPKARAEVYGAVGEYNLRKANASMEAQMNSNKVQRDAMTSDDMIKSGLTMAGAIDSQAVSVGNRTYQMNEKLKFWSEHPDQVNGPEVEQMLATARQVRAQNASATTAWLNRGSIVTNNPDGSVTYSGPSNGSFIKDQKDRDAIIKASTAQVDLIIDAVTNKDYGAAAGYATSNKLITDRALNEVYVRDSSAVTTKILDTVGGQQLVQEANRPGTAYAEERLGMPQRIMTIIAKSGVNPGPTGTASGKNPDAPQPPPSATSEVKRLADSGLSKDEQAKTVKQSLTEIQTFIQTGKDPKQLENAVNFLFGPENGEFIQTVVKPEERAIVFAQMTSPATSQAIFKASQTTPGLWEKYNAWVAKSFKITFGTAAADLQKAIQQVPGAASSWDPVNLRINYQGKVSGPQDILAGGSLFANIDKMIQGDANGKAQKAVDGINATLSSIKNIAEMNGEDGNVFLAKAIQSLDIDFKAQPQGSVLNMLWTALNPFISREPNNPFQERNAPNGSSVLPSTGNQNQTSLQPQAPANSQTAGNASVSPDTTGSIPKQDVAALLQNNSDKLGRVQYDEVNGNAYNSAAVAKAEPIDLTKLSPDIVATITPAKMSQTGQKVMLKPTDPIFSQAPPAAAHAVSAVSTMTGGKVPPMAPSGVPITNVTGKNAVQVAQSFLGQNEVDNTDTIAQFIHSAAGLKINPANTPWCAAWANAVLASSGYAQDRGEGVGKGRVGNGLWAMDFEGYGTDARANPAEGDVIVFRWKGGGGHVGFYMGTVDVKGVQYAQVLGGNQGGAAQKGGGVTITLEPMSAVSAIRHPVPANASQLAGAPEAPKSALSPGQPATPNLATAGKEMMKGQQEIAPQAQQQVAANETPEQLQKALDAVEKQIQMFTKRGQQAPANLMNQRVKLKEQIKNANQTG